MRILHPMPHVIGFYDGRLDGTRLHGPQENWLDDGGFTLGTCSYAIIDGPDALVYDTHMTLDHARAIRATLEAAGATRIRVVLSHHHLDHIAGNQVFADCEIIANAATARAMEANVAGAAAADPAIDPVILPTIIVPDDCTLTVGGMNVDLRSFDIHSHDGLCLWLPATRTLFAGDCLEDTVTYVAEPDRLAAHLADLDRMADLPVDRILPNHGDPDLIGAGGYPPSLIAATRAYVTALLQVPGNPDLARQDLQTFIADQLADGSLHHIPAYDAVHDRNIAEMQALARTGATPT